MVKTSSIIHLKHLFGCLIYLFIVIYRSPRACKEIVDDLIIQWNKISEEAYKAITFTSYDRIGNIIYHTDCMMTLLNDHAVICFATIENKKERE